jgi:GGDEF domain-containing protein
VDTRRRHLRVVATSIRDGDQIRYVLTSFADITAERRMAEELRQLSVIDEFTEINNRPGFLLAARTELARVQRARRPGVLLFIDLHGLMTINDTYGDGVVAMP